MDNYPEVSQALFGDPIQTEQEIIWWGINNLL